MKLPEPPSDHTIAIDLSISNESSSLACELYTANDRRMREPVVTVSTRATGTTRVTDGNSIRSSSVGVGVAVGVAVGGSVNSGTGVGCNREYEFCQFTNPMLGNAASIAAR